MDGLGSSRSEEISLASEPLGGDNGGQGGRIRSDCGGGGGTILSPLPERADPCVLSRIDIVQYTVSNI